MVFKTVMRKGAQQRPEETKASIEEGASKRRGPFEDTQSGNLSIPLGNFSAGSSFAPLSFTVSGKTFFGRLKDFANVNVSESPVVYDADGATQSPGNGNQRAFILDFGGLRSVLKVFINASAAKITLLLPWMGTGFADKSVFPTPVDQGFQQFKPKRDGNGQATVGIPALDTQKLLVQVQPASGSAFSLDDINTNLGLTTATFPTNVKAYLDGRLPFWTHPGILNGDAEVTGLAEDLNAFLSQQTGSSAPKLIFSTDTPGVLSTDLSLNALTPDLQAAAQWGGQASLDVPLQALQASPVELLFPNTGAKAWRISHVSLGLKGQFPPWRAFPAQAESDPGAMGLQTNARFSVARMIVFNEAVELHGFSIPGISSQGKLLMELYKDAQHQPMTGKPVASVELNPAAAPVTADPGNSAVTPGATQPQVSVWTDGLLASPINLDPGTYWLTLKAKTGAFEWRGTSAPLAAGGDTLVSQEGGPWRLYPRLNPGTGVTPLFPSAQALILRKPLPKENQPLLDLHWTIAGADATAQGEATQTATTQELQLPAGKFQELTPIDGAVTLPIQVTARASGTLTLTASAFYKEKNP